MKNISTLITCLVLIINLNAQTPNSFESRGIGGGGALFSPSINPADHNEIYLSCDLAALFHSKDKGKSWGIVPFQEIQSGHDSYVSFTNNPLIRYTVDYGSFVGDDQIRPMKSIDGGLSWNVISGNPYPLNPDGGILRLIADYNNPDHLIIADYGTIYYSENGGTSFKKIHDNVSSGAGNHLAGVFFDNNKIYIGTNDGIVFSTNGGTSFSVMSTTGIPNGQYILSFAGGKENGVTRFVCLTSTSVYAGYQYGSDYYDVMSGIYTMDDISGNWTLNVNGINKGEDFPVFVGMASNDIDTMYCSGGNSSGAPIVMRIIPGVNAWDHTFKTQNNQNITTGWSGTNGDHAWTFPEAPFGFQVCPNDASTVIISTYSDAYLTENGGISWKQKYMDEATENPAGSPTPKQKKYHGIGLENTTNWQIMWSDSTHMFSPFSDISGVISTDQGINWKFIPNLTQNSNYRIVKASNGKLYACSSNRHDIYQTTTIYDNNLNNATGNVYVSADNGTSFTQIKSFSGAVVWVATDPTNSDRLYAAVINSDTTKGGIWKTNNISSGASATWTRCTAPPRTQGHPFNINVLNNGDLVVSFSARKPTSGSNFTNSSGVFYSTNGGSSWSDRSHSKMQFYTKDVVIDPSDPTQSTWYAAVFSAWGGGIPSSSGGLYRTTDKGLNWKQISNSYRVNSCTVNPGNTNELYFTTETDGLWYTNDIKASDPVFTRVESYGFRHPVRVFFNPYKPKEMWVSSFGYGMTVANIDCNLAAPTIVQIKDSLYSNDAVKYQWFFNGNLIPNATNKSYLPKLTGAYTVEITDELGCKAVSEAFNIIITSNRDLNETQSIISIFPNPVLVGHEIIINTSKENIGKSIELYNNTGKLVKRFHLLNTINKQVMDLKPGYYFIGLEGNANFIKMVVH